MSGRSDQAYLFVTVGIDSARASIAVGSWHCFTAATASIESGLLGRHRTWLSSATLILASTAASF